MRKELKLQDEADLNYLRELFTELRGALKHIKTLRREAISKFNYYCQEADTYMDEKYDVYNSAKNDIEAVTVVIEKCDGKWSMVDCPYGACARIPASEFENHVKEFH